MSDNEKPMRVYESVQDGGRVAIYAQTREELEAAGHLCNRIRELQNGKFVTIPNNLDVRFLENES